MTPALRTARLRRLSNAVAATLGVLGSLLILLGTSRYGVGLSTDSANYIAAARSLVAGRGYHNYVGNHLLEFPPLYPALLALGSLMWPDPISVARYVNALSFGLTVFLSFRWLTRHSEGMFPSLIGSLLILLSVPLISVSVFAWTECVFTLFILLFLLQMERYRDSARDIDVALAAAFAALAFLTRYVGFTLILTGAALLLLHRHSSLHHKIRHLLLFLLLSIAPTVPWFLRNLLRSSTLVGVRFRGPNTLSALIYTAVDKITTWWLPETLPFIERVGLSAVILVSIAGGSMVALGRDQAKSVIGKVRACIPMILFIGVYMSCLILLLANIAADPLDNRYLSPIYVPLTLALTILVATIGSVTQLRSVYKSFMFICLTVWLMYPASQVTNLIHTYLDNGAGGFHQFRWATSDLINYLTFNELDGIIYNNEPDVLYLGTGQIARRSPRKYGSATRLPTNDLTAFAKSLDGNRPVYLVWFNGAGGKHSYSVEEIRARFDMEEVVRRADGAIYTVRGKKWQPREPDTNQ